MSAVPLTSLNPYQHLMMTKNASWHCQISPVRQNCPQLRTTGILFSGEFLMSSKKYYFLKPCFTFVFWPAGKRDRRTLQEGGVPAGLLVVPRNTHDKTSEKLGTPARLQKELELGQGLTFLSPLLFLGFVYQFLLLCHVLFPHALSGSPLLPAFHHIAYALSVFGGAQNALPSPQV